MSHRSGHRPPIDADADADGLERRFPRRLLLGGGAAAAALAAVEAVRPAPAEAAASPAWLLAGSPGVATDGSSFLGPTNVAPLVFKTRKLASSPITERMRLTPAGLLGINFAAPTARLDARSGDAVVIQGVCSETSGNGVAVRGEATAAGYGVRGISASGTGVRGDGSAGGTGVVGNAGFCGVQGEGNSYGGVFYGDNTGSFGVYASGGSSGVVASGSDRGVQGSGATGVYGNGSGYGVLGTAAGSGGSGVYGSAPAAGFAKGVWGHGGQYGVYGDAGSTAGVRGDSGYVGLWGQAPSYGANIVCTSTSGQVFGVYAACSSPTGFAVYAAGNVAVSGTLSKSAGSFRIDHPLDPDRRWLSHSFVESPDMMNVYNGNVVLGADGSATVELPEYFGALNRDFRYQLTCIGGHAPVYVSQKVAKNRFAIAGGTAGLEVSWQVTGIRQDDYAKEHPIVVDVPKTKAEIGTRMFVPAGSAATRMQVGPTAPAPDGKVPATPAAVTPPRR